MIYIDILIAFMLSSNKHKNKGDGIYKLMYNVEFYEDANGVSELWDFLEDLRLKSATSKDARIQHKQISLYIQLLEDNGTRLPDNITKHLGDDIWELRPGNNRVFYFYHKDDKEA